jgi:CheY-like chemotaxis protein
VPRGDSDRGIERRAVAQHPDRLREISRERRMGMDRPNVSTVLVVEDDPFQRMAIAEDLEEAGCTVVDAFNAEEALDILKRNDEISALVTDVQMAGDLDGVALARLVKDLWPEVAVIITSGLVAVSENELPTGVVFMPKPIVPERLVEEVKIGIP